MYSREKIKSLSQQVLSLEQSAMKAEEDHRDLLKHIHPEHQASACNLLHYLAIRAEDVRKLQSDLSELAISSSSHAESFTLNNLQKIKYLLSCLLGEPEAEIKNNALSCAESTKLLEHHSKALFGKAAFHGESKIMVTLSTETAEDYDMILNLVKAGMQVARINTAHDNKDVWKKMIHHVQKAAKSLDQPVKVYMDIEGPKIRTGNIEKPIHLFKGSKLTLSKTEVEGHGGDHPVVSVTLAEIFDHVQKDERVWFDDGKLGGVILSVQKDSVVVEITQAPEDGFKLKAEKGVNFPDSNLKVSALTNEDLDHLKFIARHADMVGYSFVQQPEDIYLLQKHLEHHERKDIGIILKIETRLAFENFPSLLLAVMRSKHCGVMIARGDLAVEIGYLRIAEVQEEIMWLAEAANLPVIWATEVLDNQVKKGMATRAEISDVVKAVRAECVMLNKGPHIIEAIATVRDIDKRMAAHEDKKRKILRPLQVARTFLGSDPKPHNPDASPQRG